MINVEIACDELESQEKYMQRTSTEKKARMKIQN